MPWWVGWVHAVALEHCTEEGGVRNSHKQAVTELFGSPRLGVGTNHIASFDEAYRRIFADVIVYIFAH